MYTKSLKLSLNKNKYYCDVKHCYCFNRKYALSSMENSNCMTWDIIISEYINKKIFQHKVKIIKLNNGNTGEYSVKMHLYINHRQRVFFLVLFSCNLKNEIPVLYIIQYIVSGDPHISFHL